MRALGWVQDILISGGHPSLIQHLGFFGYYQEFITQNSGLTEKINSLRNEQQLVSEEGTDDIESNFKALKAVFVTKSGPVRHFPISEGSPGGGEFILHIDWSKWGIAGILYQDQGGPTCFIRTIGWKMTSYEANYHSSKGKLAASNFALQKFQHLLFQGEFLIQRDNRRVSNWISMKDPGGTIHRWMFNFSFFNFRI